MKSPAFPIRSFSGWPLFGHASPGSFVRRKSMNRVRTSASGSPAFSETIFFFALSRSLTNFPSNS